MKLKYFLVFALGLSVLTSCLPSPALFDSTAKLNAIDPALVRAFPVPILFSGIPHLPWIVEYTEAEDTDTEALQTYLTLLKRELEKYPDRFFQDTHLNGIAVVKNLTVQGQRRSAMPDVFTGILYFDFTRGLNNPIYQQHVIHHEYFHMFGGAYHGNPYLMDPDWAALNTPGFTYGNGGATMQTAPNAAVINHPLPGFVDLYATSGLEEDKAEIYATFFVPSEWAKVAEWIKTDDILARKVAALKAFLREICPEMDEAFWTRLPQDQ